MDDHRCAELEREVSRLRETVASLRRLLADARVSPRRALRGRLRGTCPVCERDVAVREDGTLRLHSPGSGDARGRVRTCDGSLLPPVAEV